MRAKKFKSILVCFSNLKTEDKYMPNAVEATKAREYLKVTPASVDQNPDKIANPTKDIIIQSFEAMYKKLALLLYTRKVNII